MDEAEVVGLLSGLDGVRVLTASEEGGAPQAAWGDSFCYAVLPGGAPDPQHQQPFATLVRSDYPGYDESSRLDRPGAYRLNLAIGRERYERLLGHAPAEHDRRGEADDHAEVDVLLPHPLYAAQGWVAVVEPGPRTADLVRELVVHSRDLALARLRRRDAADT